MNDEVLKARYRSILNELNQINQKLIFFEDEFQTLKDSLLEETVIDGHFLKEDVYERVDISLKEISSTLNNQIIPSISQKI